MITTIDLAHDQVELLGRDVEALTKKRKLYLAALALAGGAWLVDRGFSSGASTGPASAEASIVVPASERTVPTAAVQTPAVSDTLSVSEQLRSLVQANGVESAASVDAFRPSADWLADSVPVAKPEAESAPSPPPTRVFAEQHHLTGVMVADQQHLVIVNGKALRIGQTVDGFKLVEIGDRSAVFENEDHARVTLPMREPAPLASPRGAR